MRYARTRIRKTAASTELQKSFTIHFALQARRGQLKMVLDQSAVTPLWARPLQISNRLVDEGL
jgi:hypothetical protein